MKYPREGPKGAMNPILLSKYTSILHFKDDEFEVTTATKVEEAKQVLSTGFDYIAEENGIMLFRRPKRFRGLNTGIGV